MPLRDLTRFHSHAPFAFQIARIVSEGADVFESFRVLEKISRPEDWTPQLCAAADQWRARGEQAAARGKFVTAREAFLLANHFYRAAALWNVPDPSATTSIYLRSVECFRRAAELANPPIEAVKVPFDRAELPGYLYRPYHAAQPLPAVVLMGGADATKEECDGFGAQQIADRGMMCLTLDGPGQGEPLRLHGVPTRHDYEVVFGAAIDYLQSRPEVDPHRIGIIGLSFGGYYVARGALDPRVKGAVVWGALFDVLEGLTMLHNNPDHPALRLISGADSPAAMRAFFSEFTLRDVAGKITCPVLITHGGEDRLVDPSEGHRLFEALNGPKQLEFYPDGLHCCVEYYAQMRPMMFDWLYDRLAGEVPAAR